MHVITTQHHISLAFPVLKIEYSASNLIGLLVKKDMLLTIRGPDILPVALPIILICLKMDRTHFNQQWMSVLTTQNHISQADLGLKISYFA